MQFVLRCMSIIGVCTSTYQYVLVYAQSCSTCTAMYRHILPCTVRDHENYIWNSDLLYRNRVFSTYLYVLVRTRYIYISTDRYIPVRMYQNNVMYVGPSQGHWFSVGALQHTCQAHTVSFPTGIRHKTASSAILLETQYILVCTEYIVWYYIVHTQYIIACTSTYSYRCNPHLISNQEPSPWDHPCQCPDLLVVAGHLAPACLHHAILLEILWSRAQCSHW